MLKQLIKNLIVIIIGIIIGTMLLMISYILPANRIEKNINKSIEIFKKEETYENEIYGYKITQLDNFTDAIMLQNASYTGSENIIEKSMNVYRYSNDKNPCKSLIMQLEQNNKNTTTYDRYWHGYLTILKPVLMIFSYNDIRLINSIIQPLLITALIYLLIKKNKERYVLPYIISIILISPITIAKSLQFSTVFYILNISMMIMLLYNDKLNKKNGYIYFFTIVGMITSYLDFLTYPLATLGMALTLYLILNQDKKTSNNIKTIISKSVIWGIGYAGMWGGKILIGSVLLKKNLFINALKTFEVRTSLEVGNANITIISVLRNNIARLITKPYILLMIIIVAYVAYKMIKIKFKPKKEVFRSFIPFFIISMMPFFWYAVASNHSYIHSWFTYRTMIVTIFAILSYISLVIELHEGGKNEKRK